MIQSNLSWFGDAQDGITQFNSRMRAPQRLQFWDHDITLFTLVLQGVLPSSIDLVRQMRMVFLSRIVLCKMR